MHAARPHHDAIALALRWVALVLAAVLALTVVLMAIVTAPARADPGTTPDQTGPDQQQLEQQAAALAAAVANGTPTGSYTGPEGNVRWVGVTGTHAASTGYGYPYPAAPDCVEASLGAGCVGDARGFIQGQCTSWVASRLASRNGLSFSNWYADRHWGNAADWAKVAKNIGHRADKTPAVGAIAWYKRGHVGYVEAVYSATSLLVSQMNTDGHNGFAVSVVSPGSRSWPDKFIHLADVVPVDLAPPTVPTDLHAVAHRGRTGVAWRPSSDAWGVAGYRVLRDGVPLASTGRTSYWDTTPPVGRTTVYSVVAYDAAGHTSRPARVRVTGGVAAEAVDRAWVESGAGPALCGRTGTAERPTIGCRVLTGSGWREVGSEWATPWGGPTTRAFVPSREGGLSYCRAVGSSQRRLACTSLDPSRLAWGFDSTSGRMPRLDPVDRAWLDTTAGPAQCGRIGGWSRPRVSCSVLTAAGWQTITAPARVTWGQSDTRSFVVTRDGSVAFCRALAGGAGGRLACATLDTARLTWREESTANSEGGGHPTDGSWLATAAGPAFCWSSGRAGGGCRVLTEGGWHLAPLPGRVDRGAPAGRAFLADQAGRVSWCTVTPGRAVACTGLSDDLSSWGRTRSTRPTRSWQPANRTWISTSTGPALCGRTGTAADHRLGCQVLTGRGWRTTSSHRVAWGNAGYRAFVPSGAGVAYCNTVPVKRGTAVACTRMSNLEWGASHTSRRVRLAYADPF